MEPFWASNFFGVIRGLAEMAAHNADEPNAEEQRVKLHKSFKNYQPTFREIGLSASKASAYKIAEKLAQKGCHWGDISALCKELQGRLIDETDDKEFFVMTARETHFFNEPRRGWEKSLSRFPSIVDDVEEAAKCLALSRYAAAVFHSVQIVEAGLIELGTFLKVTDPHSGWTAVSHALRKVIDKPYKERTAFERKNFVFLEQMQATVEGLKNAWRNKISHVGGRLVIMTGEFSPDVAEEILFATRAFMRRLAEGLPPPKGKKIAK
jgi:hypothetical protein